MLILISPIILDLLICCSIDKVPKITSPVLVIHGTEDEVIDFSHGLTIYERCPRKVEPLWVEGAGHNDVELYGQYLDRLKQFINVELALNWLEVRAADSSTGTQEHADDHGDSDSNLGTTQQQEELSSCSTAFQGDHPSEEVLPSPLRLVDIASGVIMDSEEKSKPRKDEKENDVDTNLLLKVVNSCATNQPSQDLPCEERVVWYSRCIELSSRGIKRGKTFPETFSFYFVPLFTFFFLKHLPFFRTSPDNVWIIALICRILLKYSDVTLVLHKWKSLYLSGWCENFLSVNIKKCCSKTMCPHVEKKHHGLAVKNMFFLLPT